MLAFNRTLVASKDLDFVGVSRDNWNIKVCKILWLMQ
jgi:hypothetical protein